jgi:hypothetical protein
MKALRALFRILVRLPALYRGMKVIRSIERQQKEAEKARMDRLRHPDKYRI